MSTTKKLYNNHSNKWKRDKPQSLSDFTARPVLIKMCGDVKRKKILDLGCGEGYVTRQLIKKDPSSIDGLDISKKMIDLARKSQFDKRVTYQVGNAVKLKFEDDKYDLVYVDPPYGTSNKKTPTSRVRYQSYYHIWTTICLNDKPNTLGVANRRQDASSDSIKSSISDFEKLDLKYVEDSFVKLIDKFKNSYIIVSYNNRSKVTICKLLEIFDKRIDKHISFDYKENAQTNAVTNSNYKIMHKEPLKEHLFLLNPT